MPVDSHDTYASPSASPSPTARINFYIWVGLNAASTLYATGCDVLIDWDTSRVQELFSSNENFPFSNCPMGGLILVVCINFFCRCSWVLRLLPPAFNVFKNQGDFKPLFSVSIPLSIGRMEDNQKCGQQRWSRLGQQRNAMSQNRTGSQMCTQRTRSKMCAHLWQGIEGMIKRMTRLKDKTVLLVD